MNQEHKNPWKTLKYSTIYNNPWIELREDKVVTPGGGDGIYGVVSFKNYALGILPLDDELNTWIVGQYRYPLDEYSWEIPMGGGPLDEDIIQSAKRELKEETGIIANNWKELLKIHTSNSVTNETGYVYIATDLSFEKSEAEETEVLAIKKLPFSEVFEMVMRNEITDSISMAGIMKTKALIDSGEFAL